MVSGAVVSIQFPKPLLLFLIRSMSGILRVEALAIEGAEFNLGYIEPTAVFTGV